MHFVIVANTWCRENQENNECSPVAISIERKHVASSPAKAEVHRTGKVHDSMSAATSKSLTLTNQNKAHFVICLMLLISTLLHICILKQKFDTDRDGKIGRREFITICLQVSNHCRCHPSPFRIKLYWTPLKHSETLFNLTHPTLLYTHFLSQHENHFAIINTN